MSIRTKARVEYVARIARVLGLAATVWVKPLAAQDRTPVAETAPTSSSGPASPGTGCPGRPPLPGDVRCVASGEREGDPQPLLWIPRALLAGPRILFMAALQPILLGVGLEEEYQISRRVNDVFWNDAHTFGVFPTGLLETSLTPKLGGRLVHRDLFGRGEQLRARAAYGSVYDQVYEASLDSGSRIKGGQLQLGGGYRRLDGQRFFGLGSGDPVPPDSLSLPLDPGADGPTVETRYRTATAYSWLSARAPMTASLSLGVTHNWRLLRLEDSTSGSDVPNVTEVFERGGLVGFGEDLIDAYTQLDLRWDGRRQTRVDRPRAVPSGGLRLDVWAGVQKILRPRRAVISRFGVDLRPTFNLFRGNRTLRLRLRGVYVSGDIRNVPVTDLAHLGGPHLLRGYHRKRAQGRLTWLTSAEYHYPVQEGIDAYLFTDVGRAYAGFVALSFEHMRVGFGAGIEIFTIKQYLVRLQLASSIDGGLFFHVRFNSSDAFETTQ